MILRREQIEAFRQKAEADFVNTTSVLMQECWPDRCQDLSPQQLREKVRRGIHSAQSFDIQGDQAICGYLNVWFAMGESFPSRQEHPWAFPVLESRDLDPSQKVDQLLALTIEKGLGTAP